MVIYSHRDRPHWQTATTLQIQKKNQEPHHVFHHGGEEQNQSLSQNPCFFTFDMNLEAATQPPMPSFSNLPENKC